MALVLAIEPDPRQASILERVVREQVRAQLVLVDSKDAAIAALASRIPDVILITALLPPRDEQEITDHLRTLQHTEHLQTVAVPLLTSEEDGGEGGGLFNAFRRKRRPRKIDGCDQAVFAEQVREHIQRAAEVRAAHEIEPPCAPAITVQLQAEAQPVACADAEPTPSAAPITEALELDMERQREGTTGPNEFDFAVCEDDEAPDVPSVEHEHVASLDTEAAIEAVDETADSAKHEEDDAAPALPLARLVPFTTLEPLWAFLAETHSDAPVRIHELQRARHMNPLLLADESAIGDHAAVRESTGRVIEQPRSEEPARTEMISRNAERSGSRGAVAAETTSQEGAAAAAPEPASGEIVEPPGQGRAEAGPANAEREPSAAPVANADTGALDLALWDHLFVALEERLNDDLPPSADGAVDPLPGSEERQQTPRRPRARRPRKRKRAEMPETLPSVGPDGQWLASEIAALRRALEKLHRDNGGTRREEDRAAEAANPTDSEDQPQADTTFVEDDRRPNRPKRGAQAAVQDEWGFYDPDQCGMAALRARLANPMAAWARSGDDASPADIAAPLPDSRSPRTPSALADHALAVRYASGVRIRRVRVQERRQEPAGDKSVVIVSRKSLRKGR